MGFKNFVRRNPALSYFVLTFLISWLSALLMVGPKLVHGISMDKMDGILMFPVMILGPAASSVIVTFLTQGKPGLLDLRSRMFKLNISFRWYLMALIIPPSLILITLTILKNFISPTFSPNFFPLGILFAIPAGFFEEIGWTGFAFPQLHSKFNFEKSAIVVGLLWGIWHIPVIDFLGTAYPHGKLLVPFFISFIAILAAMRIFISWIYLKTRSVFIAQFMHAVSTGSLVMLGPPKVNPSEETLWYASYAVLLWITALIFLWLEHSRKSASGKKEQAHLQSNS